MWFELISLRIILFLDRWVLFNEINFDLVVLSNLIAAFIKLGGSKKKTNLDLFIFKTKAQTCKF